jgi:hypothetical protein
MVFTLTIIICILVAFASGQVLTVNDCSQWSDGNQICVRAKLYRDGTLAGEITTQSDNSLHGCRGGAMAVGSDEAGKALWTAKLQGKTACSLSDPSCASFQRQEVMAHVDVEAAKQTCRIHLFYNFDGSFCERQPNKVWAASLERFLNTDGLFRFNTRWDRSAVNSELRYRMSYRVRYF